MFQVQGKNVQLMKTIHRHSLPQPFPNYTCTRPAVPASIIYNPPKIWPIGLIGRLRQAIDKPSAGEWWRAQILAFQ